MERETLIENTKRGMAAAKARGVKLGGRAKVFSRDILSLRERGMTMAEDKSGRGIHLPGGCPAPIARQRVPG